MYFSQICITWKLTINKKGFNFCSGFCEKVKDNVYVRCFRGKSSIFVKYTCSVCEFQTVKVWVYNCDKLYQGAVFSCHAYFTLFLRGCLVVSESTTFIVFCALCKV